MKSRPVSFYIAWLAILVCAWWIGVLLVSLVGSLVTKERDFSMLFLALMPVSLSIPAIFGIVYGIRLLRKPDRDNIKWTVGVLTLYAIFFLEGQLKSAWPSLFDGLDPLMVAFAPAMVGYLFVCKALINSETDTHVHLIDLISRGYVLCLSLILFTQLGNVLGPNGIFEERKESWMYGGGIVYFLPLVIPILFYKSVNTLLEQISKRRRISAEDTKRSV